jgi:hypothetical protein
MVRDAKWLSFICASLAALVMAMAGTVRAETAIIKVGPAPARMTLLKPGSHRYLRYDVKDGKRTAHDIWNRTVSFEMHDGRRLLHITQRWDEVNVEPGGASSLEQDSWFASFSTTPASTRRPTATTLRSRDPIASPAGMANPWIAG